MKTKKAAIAKTPEDAMSRISARRLHTSSASLLCSMHTQQELTQLLP